MNKILTYEGGQPVTTKDFDFLQKCYADVISALTQGVADGVNCVLFGIEYGGENKAFVPGHATPGAVCIENNIYIVTEELTGTSEKYLCIRDTQSEDRIFKDSQTHKVYLTHEAYLSNTTDGAYGFIDLTKVKFLKDIISREAFWEFDDSVTLNSDTSGIVEIRRDKNGFERRIRVEKNSSVDNVLYTYGTSRLPNPKVCVAVDETKTKAVVLVDVLGSCCMYNVDGTEYKSTATFKNVILK